MYRIDSPDEFKFFKRLLLIGTGLGVGGWLFFGAGPSPEPASENAFGCYVGRDAPPIRLSEQGLQILSLSFPPIAFRLSRGKLGIDMIVERQLVPVPRDVGCALKPGSGQGQIYRFVNLVDGRVYGQFDEMRLNHFQIVGDDGTVLNYLRAAPSNCRPAAG